MVWTSAMMTCNWGNIVILETVFLKLSLLKDGRLDEVDVFGSKIMKPPFLFNEID